MDEIILGIIIPVYNEAENIAGTINTIEKNVGIPHKIFIVYDFEEDNTIPIAKKMLQKGINIGFIFNEKGGVVNAIRLGLRQAEGKYLLVTMADMSDDYSIVDRMCDLMSQGYDLICGSRYMKDGKQIGGPFIKKILSRTAGISLKYLTGLPTHDATNSFKLYRKSMLDSLKIESDGGFEIGLELVVKAHFSGYKVTEIPCVWMDRESGESRFKIIKWAPNYLKWYFFAIKKGLKKTCSLV